VILDALMKVEGRRDRVLARLPLGHDRCCRGRPITMEHVMDWSAITYPYATLNDSAAR
jgi:hypothetical protein